MFQNCTELTPPRVKVLDLISPHHPPGTALFTRLKV